MSGVLTAAHLQDHRLSPLVSRVRNDWSSIALRMPLYAVLRVDSMNGLWRNALNTSNCHLVRFLCYTFPLEERCLIRSQRLWQRWATQNRFHYRLPPPQCQANPSHPSRPACLNPQFAKHPNSKHQLQEQRTLAPS